MSEGKRQDQDTLMMTTEKRTLHLMIIVQQVSWTKRCWPSQSACCIITYTVHPGLDIVGNKVIIYRACIMDSELPSFLIWSLCIKCLVHHEVYSVSWSCLVLFMQSLYTLSNLLNFLFTCVALLMAVGFDKDHT